MSPVLPAGDNEDDSYFDEAVELLLSMDAIHGKKLVDGNLVAGQVEKVKKLIAEHGKEVPPEEKPETELDSSPFLVRSASIPFPPEIQGVSSSTSFVLAEYSDGSVAIDGWLQELGDRQTDGFAKAFNRLKSVVDK